MSHLMDELKKAERTRSAGVRAPAEIRPQVAPGRPSPVPAMTPHAAPRPGRSLGVMAAILLLGGALVYAVYVWLHESADRPPAAASVAAAAAPASAQQAQAALQRGDIRRAYMEYQRVLAVEPGNRVALHGLAEIALSQGQEAVAGNYYQRALQVDPRDLRAEVGLIGLQARQAPQAAEARLRDLLAQQPEEALLHYALGNLQASRSDWPEAQAAFLQAYRIEPDNPDYLFNLAVSFDALHQPQQALRFYRLALAAAEQRPASFDRRQAQMRLAALQTPQQRR